MSHKNIIVAFLCICMATLAMSLEPSQVARAQRPENTLTPVQGSATPVLNKNLIRHC